jgi:hypothetical protein
LLLKFCRAFDTETLSSTITLNWYAVHSRQLFKTNSSDPIPTISLAQRFFFFPMHLDTTSLWKPIAKLNCNFTQNNSFKELKPPILTISLV